MTDRERTIKWLECCGGYNDELEHVGCTSECPYWENENCCNSSQPFKDALELLKEQEPKKVKTDMYGNAYCPWCSTERTIKMGLQKLHLGTNFCPWCGQKVKWDD